MGSYTGFQFLNPMIGGGLYGNYDGAYLLDDEFSDTLAAGAVNGTPATPGPGLRAVTDTTNKLSVAGGNLAITGGVAWGDPAYGLTAIAREAGRIGLFKLTLAGVLSHLHIGFKSIYTSVILNEAVLYFSNGGILYIYISGGGTTVTPGVYTATTYQVAVVLRGTGAHFFIKGGAFANWSLLYSSIYNNTASLSPAITNHSHAPLFDYVRVPAQTWWPTPIASDSFNRGNGVLGNTDGLAVEEIGGSGLPWTDNVGTWAILGNKVAASALVGGVAIATVESGKTDGLVTGTLTRSAGTLGIVLRYVDSDNFMRAEHDGTNCRLITRIAGVEATAITAIVAIGAGVIHVISQGTSHALYLNNAQVGVTTVVAGLTTGTRIGLHTTDTGNSFDNLYDFARGTSGEYTILNSF